MPADAEALHMIAEAAEGSVRDGLSILDQAIAHADLGGEGLVTPAQVQEMLGLADKSVQRKLLAALLEADAPAVLELVEAQFALGVEPLALLRSQMELVHAVTVAQVSRTNARALSPEERAAIDEWAGKLSAGQLHRLWQLLLKGFEEVRSAPDPLVAAQMALLRVLHAADLPDPGQLARKLEALAANPAAFAAAPAGDGQGAPAAAPVAAVQWATLVEQVEQASPMLGASLRLGVRVVSLAPGHLRYQLAPGLPPLADGDIRKGLDAATALTWQVERAEGDAAPSLEEARAAAESDARDALRRSPLVAAAFAAFPGAELIEDEAASRSGERNWSRSA